MRRELVFLLFSMTLAWFSLVPPPAQAGPGKYLLAGLVAKAVKKAGTTAGKMALKKLILYAKRSPKIKSKILDLANAYVGHNDTLDAAAHFVMSSVERGGIDQQAFDRFMETARADAIEAAQERYAAGAAGRYLKSPLGKKIIEKAATARDYYEYLKQRKEAQQGQ